MANNGIYIVNNVMLGPAVPAHMATQLCDVKVKNV
jgi:hypothetical protein